MDMIQQAPLRIREQDGAPNVIPVYELVVSNGTLTNLGQGKVSLATGAGGTSPTYAATGNSYVVMASAGDLTAERQLEAPPSSGPPDMEVTDGGANSTLVLRPRGWNPRRTFFFGWDVTGSTIASATETTSIGAGVTVAAAFIDDEMGAVNLDTITSITPPDGGYINTPNQMDFDNNTEVWIRFRARDTGNRRVFVGITNDFTACPPIAASHHAGFVLDDAASSNFRRRTSDGTGPATEANYTPAITADTAWHTARIRRTSTQVGFTLDSNAEELVTATLPAVGTGCNLAAGVVSSVSNVDRNLDISYWFAWRTGMSR